LRGITVLEDILYRRKTALANIDSMRQGIWLYADMIDAFVAGNKERTADLTYSHFYHLAIFNSRSTGFARNSFNSLIRML